MSSALKGQGTHEDAEIPHHLSRVPLIDPADDMVLLQPYADRAQAERQSLRERDRDRGAEVNQRPDKWARFCGAQAEPEQCWHEIQQLKINEHLNKHPANPRSLLNVYVSEVLLDRQSSQFSLPRSPDPRGHQEQHRSPSNYNAMRQFQRFAAGYIQLLIPRVGGSKGKELHYKRRYVGKPAVQLISADQQCNGGQAPQDGRDDEDHKPVYGAHNGPDRSH